MHQPLKFGIDTILGPSFGSHGPSTASLSGIKKPHPQTFYFAPRMEIMEHLPISSGSLSDVPSPSSSLSPKSSNTSPLSIGSGPSEQRGGAFPAWVFCTRYSDRPSCGSRTRKPRKKDAQEDEKRPRTAFTQHQLDRLKKQFIDNRYLTEKKRQELAHELGLHESQIKIWFQNKRAKLKKSSGDRPSLGVQSFNQGMFAGILP